MKTRHTHTHEHHLHQEKAPKISIFIKNTIKDEQHQAAKQESDNSQGCFEALKKLFCK